MNRTSIAFLVTVFLSGTASGQAPDFGRLMITEVSWAEPQGIEITNFSTAAIDLANWRVGRMASPGPVGVMAMVTLDGSIQPGESIIVAEAGAVLWPVPYPEAPPGTRVLPLLGPLGIYTTAINWALLNPAFQAVDVVYVSATDGSSNVPAVSGGTFRGLAVRSSASAMSLERIWGLDSDSGRDWTEENVRSFGLENRSAGPRGTDPVAEPRILFTEIDDSPDYLELHNCGPASVDLQDFLILASRYQGDPQTRLRPFPGSVVLPAGDFLVIGDSASAPAELPSGIPYVNLAAVGGGTLPLHWEEFSLALYDNLGRLLDLVRVTGDDDGVVHNHPRAPAAWNAFTGAAARQGGIGGGSFGRSMGISTFSDSDRGGDWRGLFLRSMGYYNPMWVGAPGISDLLDVRMNETSLGDGLTIIINAGPTAAGLAYSYLFSLGHLAGAGPFFGLGQDSLTNWIVILATPPFSGVLDGRGSARVDLPHGSLPPGLQADCIFILQSASGTLMRRTAIVEFDT